MKTRTTRVTLTKNSISDSDCFDIEITDEGGEYLIVSCGINGNSISIDPSEWPFLRDAIDRMFVEIAENESEGKLKKLLETPAPWEKASEEQAKPDAEAPPREQSSPIGARTSGASGEEQAKPACDDGWIPWNGGAYPPLLAEFRPVKVHLRDGTLPMGVRVGWRWDWTHYDGDNDIIAYKVVD